MNTRPYEDLYANNFKETLREKGKQVLNLAVSSEVAFETYWVYSEANKAIEFLISAYGTVEDLDWNEGVELSEPRFIKVSDGESLKDIETIIEKESYIPIELKLDVFSMLKIIKGHLPIEIKE